MHSHRPELRAEIDASWRRAEDAGLDPDQFDVPYATDAGADGSFVSAARPVVAQLVDDLDANAISVILTDREGRLLDRRVPDRRLRDRLDRISLAPGFVYSEDAVGTNAIGTALAGRTPSFVNGGEHFAHALARKACAAAPVLDPRSGQVLGAIDLSCEVDDASGLMLPLVRRAAREIELRLVEEGAVAERATLQQFLRARRGAKTALVLVNGRTMITNAAAGRLVSPADEDVLWDRATELLASADKADRVIALSGGTEVQVRAEPLIDGGVLLGALLTLRPVPTADLVVSSRRSRRPFGWDSLTDTEKSVMQLVADGLTNVETAERLFISRHTVDYHLRAIYRKLDVGSRLDLARLVFEHQALDGHPA